MSTAHLEAGDEAVISYSLARGGTPSGRLLLDYGFCTPFSLADEVKVPLLDGGIGDDGSGDGDGAYGADGEGDRLQRLRLLLALQVCVSS